jgi:hypothetical protein
MVEIRWCEVGYKKSLKTELSYSEIAFDRTVFVKILRAKVNFFIFTF